MAKSRRVTVSLPPDIVDKLDYVSRRLRSTRSGLLSVILRDSIDPLVEIASALPDPGLDPTQDDVRRFRGESARVISELVDELQRCAHDVTKD